MNKIYNFERTKTGKAAMWEKGGAYSNTGESTIIADKNGYSKKPLYVRTHGDLACGNHALIPIAEGDIIVTVNRHHDKIAVMVERITSIMFGIVEVEPGTDCICDDAIYAAIAKANDYHCREPYYIKNSGGKDR